MVRKISLFFLSVMMLASCRQAPIPQSDFSDICYDMLIVRHYVENTPGVALSTDSLSVYGAILEKYGYSVDDYRSTVEYYVNNPQEYSLLLKGVQARILADQDEVQKRIKLQNEARASSFGIIELSGAFHFQDSVDIPAAVLRELFP